MPDPRYDALFDTLSTAEKLEFRKQDLEAAARRQDMRAGIWKVVYGTCIVGIAAALFPAVQNWSQYYYDYRSELRRIQIEENQSNQQRLIQDRAFLESLSDEGRNADLDKRIMLAEYYVFLSEDEAEKLRWNAFHDHLLGLRQAQWAAVLRSAELSASADAGPVEQAVARATAQLHNESAAAGGASSAQPVLPPSFEQSLRDLMSDTTVTRRAARQALADLGPVLVRPALDELGAGEGLAYREELGLVVALTFMMRDHKAQRAAIANGLTGADLETLMLLAADPDRQIRIHAGEFLFDLGDPRVFDLVPALWDRVGSDDGRFQLALALKGAAPFVPPAQRGGALAVVRALMGTVGPNTDALLRDAGRLLGG